MDFLVFQLGQIGLRDASALGKFADSQILVLSLNSDNFPDRQKRLVAYSPVDLRRLRLAKHPR
jgi:hypothetical protein